MRKLVLLLCIAYIVVLDVCSKQWMSHALLLGEAWPIFPGFNLTLAHNTGAAFSFLADENGWQRIALSGVSLVAIVGFSIWLVRTSPSQAWTSLGLASIIGGAIGNLIDRVCYGYVIDFLDVYIGLYHWPAFNIADSAICVGAFFLLIGMVRGES